MLSPYLRLCFDEFVQSSLGSWSCILMDSKHLFSDQEIKMKREFGVLKKHIDPKQLAAHIWWASVLLAGGACLSCV